MKSDKDMGTSKKRAGQVEPVAAEAVGQKPPQVSGIADKI